MRIAISSFFKREKKKLNYVIRQCASEIRARAAHCLTSFTAEQRRGTPVELQRGGFFTGIQRARVYVYATALRALPVRAAELVCVSGSSKIFLFFKRSVEGCLSFFRGPPLNEGETEGYV